MAVTSVKTLARFAFVICVVTPPSLSAQAPIAPQQDWQAARTEWGDPDLEGN